jgi:prepilin-type processing-associated H-X9-DG protein
MAPIYPWTIVGAQGTRDFFKDTDINNPRPSMAYIFIGENEYSINDAFFVSDPTQPYNYWQDVPSARHGGAGSLSYADGHSEIKRWTDSSVLNFARTAGPIAGPTGCYDSYWLHQRATSFTP